MRLDRDIFRRVAHLKLTTPRFAHGPLQGDRRSPRRGRGVEFADYRPYTPGDDLRLVDWNVYGRLELLLVRLFHEDLNMTAQVVLDASASMAFGQPRKADHGAEVAACIALLGLLHQDTVTLSCIGGDGASSQARGQNSKALGGMLELLEQLEPGGVLDTPRELTAQIRGKRVDRLVFVSDMLQEPEAIEETLRVMAASSEGAILIHMLSEEELSPDLSEPQRVTDSETGEELLIAGGREAMGRYREILEEWLALVRGRCGKLGIHYVPVSNSEPVEDIVRGMMRRSGVTASTLGGRA
ncbi:MAG: DUF58 domain-containing protein [Myxococcota bacterium]